MTAADNDAAGGEDIFTLTALSELIERDMLRYNRRLDAAEETDDD